MDAFHFDIAGDRNIGIRFEQFPNELHADLLREITLDTEMLFTAVQALTPRRTGRLASEERVRIFQNKERIAGVIDIDGGDAVGGAYAKAGALEYGAHRARGVIKAHTMRLDHAWSQRLDAPIQVMVQAHGRPPNIAQYAFERGPLHALEPEIAARLNAVVEKRVAEVNR